MNFKRGRSQRLFECTLVALVSGALFVPAAAAKPAEKPKTAATKTAGTKPAAAKPEKKDGNAAAKPANKKASKAAVKPAPKAAQKQAKSKAMPLPRSRPQFAVASAPNPPFNLSATPVLATAAFAPITPAASGYLAPPPAPPAAKVAAVMPSAPLAAAESTATPAADIALVKQALDLVRRGKTSEATAVQKTIGDPLARKLTEWAILRSDENDAGFDRFAAFSGENASWPNATMLRRRAEGALWDERRSAATVLSFFRTQQPMTAKGKFALARALKAQGDEGAAGQLVRTAWREDTCSRDVERIVMETFGDALTRADHKARMDRRFYDDDSDAGMRMATLLGGNDLLIGKARKAVVEKSSNAGALLEAVPASARNDAGYIFHKAQWLRRDDKVIEAARLLQSAPRSASQLHNLDEWWVERRLVARKLLDLNEYQAAYHVARDAISPPKENLRAEHEFTAGWIALRFTENPGAAVQHFARVGQGTTNPITLARGEYWQGRAYEAAGRNAESRAHYQAAAQYPTAYYGQIARARLGLGELALRRPPESGHRAALAGLEVVRAVQILYQVEARDLVITFVSDLADKVVDAGALVVVAEVVKKNDDARAMLLLGKAALNRGFAFDVYAFPTNGIPQFRMVGPNVDKSVVFAIARQESAFNPRAVSSANALGLMQVLPGTGKLIAKKFGFRSTATACCRMPPTTPRWARPSSATCSRPIAAPTSSPSSPTMRAAAA